MQKLSLRLILLLLSLALAGCTPVHQPAQARQDGWRQLDANHSLGQTFVAGYDGLAGIEVYLAPGDQIHPAASGPGTITLHLRTDPQASADLASTHYSLAAITSAGFYTFQLPPQTASRRQYYYAFLTLEGGGSLRVGHAAADQYLDGALYENHAPLEAQTAFGLVYSTRGLALGLARQSLTWLGVLLAGLFLFVLPGWGLLNGLWPAWKGISWPEKVGLASGVSLAVYPILFLWTDLVGIHLGRLYAWLPPLAGLLWLAVKNRSNWLPAGRQLLRFRWIDSAAFKPSLSSLARRMRGENGFAWVSLTWGVLALIVCISRFWAIRDLDLPLWGDSVHHTVITQRLIEANGLFDDWQPYSESSSLTYHFGFHSAAAAFHWLTGLPAARSVLWVGQLAGIFAILALYPLAVRVGATRWGGAAAMLVAGLLSPMPMQYLIWGRYTQLAGQVILAAAVILLWAALERSNPPGGKGSPTPATLPAGEQGGSGGAAFLAAIALAGLALTHYRVVIFALTFLAAGWMLWARRGAWLGLARRTAAIGAASLVLFLPWLLTVFGGVLWQLLAYQVTTLPSQVAASIQETNALGDLGVYLPPWLWLLSAVAAGVGLWRKNAGSALVALWVLLTVLVTNPNWLGLPGAGAITNFAIAIAAYLPAGLLVGALGGWTINGAQTWAAGLRPGAPPGKTRWVARLESFIPAAACGSILLIGLWGVGLRAAAVQPQAGALASRPDLRAADWIREHTSTTARFMPAGFFAYGGTVVVGADGGWWLPYLTGRPSTLPPITYSSEQSKLPGYATQVNQLYREAIDQGITHPEMLQNLHAQQIDYLYIGQRQGSVNTAAPLFDPAQLAAHPAFRVVYHQDRVWIFEVR